MSMHASLAAQLRLQVQQEHLTDELNTRALHLADGLLSAVPILPSSSAGARPEHKASLKMSREVRYGVTIRGHAMEWCRRKTCYAATPCRCCSCSTEWQSNSTRRRLSMSTVSGAMGETGLADSWSMQAAAGRPLSTDEIPVR